MRILVIEDEADVAAFIKKALREEHYAVDAAPDGFAGEELALTEPYDLIILDIMLPKKNGLEVLKTLRDEHLHTPILLLTARNDVSDRVAGLDSGADDYLTKPFALAELRARVRALLRRQSSNKSSELKAGDLVMDTAERVVRLNGEILDLAMREYAILEYLLRNKGRILSKGMIAEHVWDYHFDSDYNLIEVYIGRLRKKIEAKAQQRFIHTIRNGGYCLREPEE